MPFFTANSLESTVSTVFPKKAVIQLFTVDSKRLAVNRGVCKTRISLSYIHPITRPPKALRHCPHCQKPISAQWKHPWCPGCAKRV